MILAEAMPRRLFGCPTCGHRIVMRVPLGSVPTCARGCNVATVVLEDCPHCREPTRRPRRGWHECARCHRQGCDECMPAGALALCPECENG